MHHILQDEFCFAHEQFSSTVEFQFLTHLLAEPFSHITISWKFFTPAFYGLLLEFEW